jgi:hypothetical protein
MTVTWKKRLGLNNSVIPLLIMLDSQIFFLIFFLEVGNDIQPGVMRIEYNNRMHMYTGLDTFCFICFTSLTSIVRCQDAAYLFSRPFYFFPHF